MGAIAAKGRRLSEVTPKPYESSFLIEELLTDRITFLAGEPKSGKSLLVAGLIRALLEHETFLGLRVFRRLEWVAIGVTDDEAAEEFHTRLPSHLHRRVTIFPIEPELEGTWEGIAQDLRDTPPGLLVIDHVLGTLGAGEDIGAPVVGTEIARRLKLLSATGVPVLAITHTPKGAVDGLTVPSSVIGGRAIAAAGRGVLALRKSKGGLRIATTMNRGRADLNLCVQLSTEAATEVPLWSLAEAKAKGTRGKYWPLVEAALAGGLPQEVDTVNALARHAKGLNLGSYEAARKALGAMLKVVDGKFVLKAT